MLDKLLTKTINTAQQINNINGEIDLRKCRHTQLMA